MSEPAGSWAEHPRCRGAGFLGVRRAPFIAKRAMLVARNPTEPRSWDGLIVQWARRQTRSVVRQSRQVQISHGDVAAVLDNNTGHRSHQRLEVLRFFEH